MEINANIVIEALTAAVACSQALDIGHDDGLMVLAANGYDHSNRFELPATKFVAQKQKEAMELVKAYNAKQAA